MRIWAGVLIAASCVCGAASDNALSITATPAAITPNGDGVNDEATIAFSFAPGKSGGVRVRVVDAGGIAVRTFDFPGKTEATFAWNGRYETGASVADGLYRVVATGQGDGGEARAETTVVVKNIPAWPEPPSAVRGMFPIGVWFDGRVEGINCPPGCVDVPNGLDAAAKYYTETFSDLKNRGLDTIVIPNTPPEYRETLLDAADRAGVKIVLELLELTSGDPASRLGIPSPAMEQDEAWLCDALSALVEPLKKHPSLLAYQLIDEPPASLFGRWRMVNRILGAIDPARPAFSALCRADELPQTATLGTQMIVFDRYPLKAGEEPGRYDFREFAALLENLRLTALPRPYWMVLQTFAAPSRYRYPTPAELRLMVRMSIAHDAKGIFFFLYNSNTQEERLQGLADDKLSASPIFDEVARLAAELKTLSPLLLRLQPVKNIVSGAPGTVDVQTFVEGGKARYVFINNMDVLFPVAFDAVLSGKIAHVTNVLTGATVPVAPGEKPKFRVSLARGEGWLLRIE